MSSKLCGVCRQPIDGDPAGWWCGEPVDDECTEDLLAAGYSVETG